MDAYFKAGAGAPGIGCRTEATNAQILEKLKMHAVVQCRTLHGLRLCTGGKSTAVVESRNNADAFEELDGPRKPKRGRKTAKARRKSQKNKRAKTTPSKSAVEFNGVDSLEANGIGDNESRAQTAATAALSRIILSRLDSTLTDRVSERNGKLNSSVTEETRVSTDITLKGVTFSGGRK